MEVEYYSTDTEIETADDGGKTYLIYYISYLTLQELRQIIVKTMSSQVPIWVLKFIGPYLTFLRE